MKEPFGKKGCLKSLLDAPGIKKMLKEHPSWSDLPIATFTQVADAYLRGAKTVVINSRKYALRSKA